MTKFVFLGSCRHEPYKILATPKKVQGKWNTEEGYQKASEIFYPSIDEADVVIVFAPDGIGEHTWRDMKYAREQGKKIVIIP